MERPSTRTLLAALSCFGAPLALLGALTPLTTGPAHADTVAPTAEGIEIPMIDPGPSAEEHGGMEHGVIEDEPIDEEDDAVASAEKWRDAGGTHASICTMGMGFGTSVQAHLDFIGRVAERLGVSAS